MNADNDDGFLNIIVIALLCIIVGVLTIGLPDNDEEGAMNDQVEQAIERMYSDTSVSQTETWDRLQEVIEHCRELQDALDEADQNKE